MKKNYIDVKEYEKLFTNAQAFVLERIAGKNKNLVLKFNSTIKSYNVNLTEVQKSKLDLILNCNIDEL